MYCTNCGKRNKDNARFCGRCGEPLAYAASANLVPPTGKRKSNTGKSRKVLVIALILAAVLVTAGIIAAVQHSRQSHAPPTAPLTEPAAREPVTTDPLHAEVEDTVLFGSYEQDNNLSNGKEAIEWLVLEKEDDRILVVSKYGLNCRNYDNTIIDTTWKSSDIRTWLNTEFRETAFGPDELGRIPAVSSADDRSTFIETGEAMDFVFLLHRDYLADYRGLALSEPCFPTAYNLSQGCFTDEENGACKWWLRVDDATYNPDFGDDIADFAYCRNFTIASGNIFDKDISVRPAIWIDLTAF